MLELLAALLIFELWSGVTLSYIAGLFNGGQGLFRSPAGHQPLILAVPGFSSLKPKRSIADMPTPRYADTGTAGQQYMSNSCPSSGLRLLPTVG